MLDKLEENEKKRYKLFKESFKEDQIQDPLLKYEQNAIGNFRNGLMYYYCDIFIVILDNWILSYIRLICSKEWGIFSNYIRFAEYYNTYTTNSDNFQYYKLKYASNFGEFERYAHRFHDIEAYKNFGLSGSNYRKYQKKTPDWPMI